MKKARDLTQEASPADASPGRSADSSDPENHVVPEDLVLDALKRILESDSFKSSKRGKQFLSFVVQNRLSNPTEPLKERTIGVALFNRPADYATGDDSVVRAQAREVRRRLEKYYSASPEEVQVRIELPLGSYSPEFKWVTAQTESTEISTTALSIPAAPVLAESSAEVEPPSRPTRWKFLFVVAAAVACFFAIVLIVRLLPNKSAPTSAIQRFWAPALASSKPLLICLPKPILYRPSAALYKRSAQSPGEFDREITRMTQPPHLQPNDTLHWDDMVRYWDFGVGEGDVRAAIRVSSFLAHQGKESEVRIGNGYTFEDLRSAPAVMIGAFDNPWTLEVTANAHFVFVDDAKGLRIQERGPSGRSWYAKHGYIGEDYGLVTRLMDASTGQFFLAAAGIEGSGSASAAELVADPDKLEKALHDAPKDWPHKNVQILVSTTSRDGVPSPPKIVAVYVW